MKPLRHLAATGLLLVAGLAACDQPLVERPAPARSNGDLAPLHSAADAVPGRYIVVLHGAPGSAGDAPREMIASVGGRLHHSYRAALNGFAATLSPGAVEALRRDPLVRYVVEDGINHPDSTIQPSATWGLDRVDQRNLPLSGTYVYTGNGAGVRVYVIDSGIRTSHAEFGGRASVGTDFVGDGQNGQDCNGHGTHVAGTIGGSTWGVAKGVQLVSVRVFPCSGGTLTSTVIAAVDWVKANVETPAVVNYSGGGGYSAAHNEAVQSLIATGVTYVTSAGNSSADACNYSPASAPAALTVGSTTSFDQQSSFSNWGGCVDLYAPGSGITSAWWSNDTATNTINGTSMAAPHVSGAAALFLQANPAATPAQATQAILGSASANRLSALGTGSPNLLLFSRLTANPSGPIISLSPGSASLVFVRPEGGAAALETIEDAPRQAFSASGAGAPKTGAAGSVFDVVTASSTASVRVVLGNTGTGPLDWEATSNRSWIVPSPGDGMVPAGGSANLRLAVDAGALALGTHTGSVAILDSAAVNSGAAVSVNVLVAEVMALDPIAPRGVSGPAGSLTYFRVSVPPEATSLTITTTGGTGDADLYVRYGAPPTLTDFDCRPYMGGNAETCLVNAPFDGDYYIMLHGWSSYANVALYASIGGPPAPPSGLTATGAAPALVHLAWTHESFFGTSFAVQRRTLGADGTTWGGWQGIGTVETGPRSYADSTVAAGNAYQYRVRACNVDGCSAWVNSGNVVTPGIAAPVGFTATVVSGTRVTLAWTDASTNETSFVVTRRARGADGVWSPYADLATRPAGSTAYNDNTVVGGFSYQYRVRACNAGGCSAVVTSPAAVVPTVPAQPASLTATVASATQVALAWVDASGNESSFSILRRLRNPDGTWGGYAEIATRPANATSFADNTVSVGSTYQYRVRACNLAGCSANATSASVTVEAVPAAPSSAGAAALSSTSVRVTWTDASANEARFSILRRTRAGDGSWGPYVEVAANRPANSTLWDETGLAPGTSYQYRVRACNLSGCSASATTASVTTSP